MKINFNFGVFGPSSSEHITHDVWNTSTILAWAFCFLLTAWKL